MKNKIIVAILIFCIAISFTSSVSAGSEYLFLPSSKTTVSTLWHEGYEARVYNATNYTSSPRSVYCYLVRYDYYGRYKKLVSTLVDPGEHYTSGWHEDTVMGSNLWSVELNPYGWATSGCLAYATLEYIH